MAAIHDGFKVPRFENDTTSDQDNVVAAGQERDTVGDEDPGFCRKQTIRSDDMICGEFVSYMKLQRVRYRLTVNMTRNVRIYGG